VVTACILVTNVKSDVHAYSAAAVSYSRKMFVIVAPETSFINITSVWLYSLGNIRKLKNNALHNKLVYLAKTVKSGTCNVYKTGLRSHCYKHFTGVAYRCNRISMSSHLNISYKNACSKL